MRRICLLVTPLASGRAIVDELLHASAVAGELARRAILVKPLGEAGLGPGYMHISTATPFDNQRFVQTLREILSDAQMRPA